MAPSPDACKHMARDPRVDAYIERAAPFAQPILAHVRALVHQACPRVEESIKWGKAPAVRKAVAKPPPQAPADLVAALAQHPAAQATFDAFPPGCRREYIEWIVEARRPETRAKRLAQALEWMGAGKRRNWKYERC